MRLAIFMTNTDESAFATHHPKDGQKFTDMICARRPEWQCQVFSVKDSVFPDTLSGLDGAMITGSPASVLDGAPWVARLLDLIRDANAARFPLFGACFGHQAIALALGGQIGKNPGGYVHGAVEVDSVAQVDWAIDLPDPFRLYASHKEQVIAAPESARIIARSIDCANAGMAIGRHIYTTQHHPEMSADFIAALTEEMAEALTPDQLARARASLQRPADGAAFAESVARFFEQAR
ncbi:type 1 glutamine amidotransferase [Arenibacterium halophilum]|uniref:Type 1 glutamine amidotransferase n=1 Tax=Arenibacterium halophilum TaxID=2583821 RepID=A0ABY2X7P8_9RHOB|nr:type 1 glutamine amidotransferase [Arenibacterium halophilum]TMV11382.1 type 1 glutamine amidotransferase [Arenibacterium halophilum]